MVLNHKAAIELLVDDAATIGFDAHTFLSLHGLLSENLMPDPDASGRLRSHPVQIGGTVLVPLAVPQAVEECFYETLGKAGDSACIKGSLPAIASVRRSLPRGRKREN